MSAWPIWYVAVTCFQASAVTPLNCPMVSKESAPAFVRCIESQIESDPDAIRTQAVMMYVVPGFITPVASWPMPSPWPVRFETSAA